MRFRADLANTRITTTTAVLVALAVVLGYVESITMPVMPLPGLRLGLANIAVVVALSTLGPRRALVVSLGRVLLVGAATGTILGPVGLMSTVGAISAWAIMTGLRSESGKYSVVGWSLGGAAAHSVTQLVAAAFIVGSAAPLMLLPISLGLSLVTGLAIGLVARLLISRMPTASYSFAGV